MPRARIDQISWQPGHYYHIYNRGARKLTIFRDDENYLFAISRIRKYCTEFQLTPVAYCLMPNHYHFLVRQDDFQEAGLLPRRVFNSYTKAFNKRFDHSGTLFEGRYKAKHVDSEPYLRQLCRYIHANPVKDGIVQRPEDWPYSNYLDWLGLRSGTLVDRQFISDLFSSSAEYQAFVQDYLRMHELPDELSYLNEYGDR